MRVSPDFINWYHVAIQDLLLRPLDDQHKRLPIFATDRVTSLSDIAMYTDADDIPLWKVLKSVGEKEQSKESSFNYKKASKAELHEYFSAVLGPFLRS